MMSRRQVGLEWFIARVFFFYGVPKVFLRVIVARLEPTLVTRIILVRLRLRLRLRQFHITLV
jgi:hypothetical protein